MGNDIKTEKGGRDKNGERMKKFKERERERERNSESDMFVSTPHCIHPHSQKHRQLSLANHGTLPQITTGTSEAAHVKQIQLQEPCMAELAQTWKGNTSGLKTALPLHGTHSRTKRSEAIPKTAAGGGEQVMQLHKKNGKRG